MTRTEINLTAQVRRLEDEIRRLYAKGHEDCPPHYNDEDGDCVSDCDVCYQLYLDAVKEGKRAELMRKTKDRK